ncbi:GIY-YIG nuclease family protein [bacterium]|nr:GIY-YIG nuclease family protein [bacterium]
MHYVYLIRSIKNSTKTYIGNTVNIKQRLETHNSGGSINTKPHRPWKLVLLLCFSDKLKATAFEKYLKSGSGREFAKRRFW